MTFGQKMDIIVDLIEQGLLTPEQAYEIMNADVWPLSMETVEMDLP